MANRNFQAFLVCLLAFMPWITGCQMKAGKRGGHEIRDEQLGSWPAGLPKTIYVSDFALESEHYKGDQGARGIMRGRPDKSGQRLKRPVVHATPEERARKIVDALSRSLIKNLSDKGFVARRLPSSQAVLPREGWLIQGVFTQMDKRNRIKRATIGFGRGANRMEAQVAVSNLAGANPKAPFIVFGTVKTPKKTPGTVVAKNPNVAAAKFVMEKNASEKDIQKTAEQIADRVLKHAQQFKGEAGSV